MNEIHKYAYICDPAWESSAYMHKIHPSHYFTYLILGKFLFNTVLLYHYTLNNEYTRYN